MIPGSKLEFSNNGKIIIDGVESDKIRLVVFDDPKKLESINGTQFRIPITGGILYREEENPRVLQGFIESSNVNTMDETMNMILLSRIYGINSKIIQTRDAGLTRALDIGRPIQ